MIYPTRFGLAYIFVILLIFLLGTNYQNNIILLLSYLLTSLFITVMFHSFYNFSSLRFYSNPVQKGYAGSSFKFPVQIIAAKSHFDLNLSFSDANLGSDLVRLNQCQEGTHTIALSFIPTQRGKQKLGRVTVFSEYSLGIFKSKTVLDFDHQAIVYPKPKPLISGQFQLSPQQTSTDEDEGSIAINENTGTDDFSELKTFVQGESRARTAWKQLAKGQGHFSKHYQANQGKLQWLNLSDMPGNNVEQRLCYLSFLINDLTVTNQTFGLCLSANRNDPLSTIAPDSGQQHQVSCLTALALYQ